MEDREPPFESLDPTDWEECRQLGHRMVDDMLEYLRTVRERPVWQPIPAEIAGSFHEPLPQAPSPAEEVYAEFREKVLPYPTGNIHPRFWGWVMGTGTPGAMLAEMLAAGLNLNQGGGAQAGGLVERQVIDWCKEMLGFPASRVGHPRQRRLDGEPRRDDGRAERPGGVRREERRRRPGPRAARRLRLARGPQLGAEGDGAPRARPERAQGGRRPRRRHDRPRRAPGRDRGRPRRGAPPVPRRRLRRDGRDGGARPPRRARRPLRRGGALVPRGRRVRRARGARSRAEAARARDGAGRFRRVRHAQVDVAPLRDRLRARAGPAAPPRRVRPDARVPRAFDARHRGRGHLVQRLRRRTLARLPGAEGVDGAEGARRGALRADRPAGTSSRPARSASGWTAEPDLELLAPVALNVVCFRYRGRRARREPPSTR